MILFRHLRQIQKLEREVGVRLRRRDIVVDLVELVTRHQLAGLLAGDDLEVARRDRPVEQQRRLWRRLPQLVGPLGIPPLGGGDR